MPFCPVDDTKMPLHPQRDRGASCLVVTTDYAAWMGDGVDVTTIRGSPSARTCTAPSTTERCAVWPGCTRPAGWHRPACHPRASGSPGAVAARQTPRRSPRRIRNSRRSSPNASVMPCSASRAFTLASSRSTICRSSSCVQRLEDHDLVDTVQELWPERPAQPLQRARAALGLFAILGGARLAPASAARSRCCCA